MRLFVTGSQGQVGTELQQHAEALGWGVTAVDYDALDITDAAAVFAALRDAKPEAVINAAAYTAVDKAESEQGRAFAVNRDGAANLAAGCAELGIPLVHYSTDYVFDGSKAGGYVEGDPVAPLGVYGASKLAGERAVRSQCPLHLILRTSWVFSAHGHNFVKTMLRLGSERETLKVVADQYGKPTSAGELARLTLAMLPKAEGRWGTYHVAQPDATSWYGFAEAIFSEARQLGVPLLIKHVCAIDTKDYPTPAVRPANSVLDCTHVARVFGMEPHPWRTSLREVIAHLAGKQGSESDLDG